jgi:hypothetical protein
MTLFSYLSANTQMTRLVIILFTFALCSAFSLIPSELRAEPGVFQSIDTKPLNEIYTVGKGHRYKISFIGSDMIDLLIYVSDVAPDRIGFEFFMQAPGPMGLTKMWQQFHLARESGQLKLKEGSFLTSDLSNPETMPLNEVLKKSESGLQLTDFLMTTNEVTGHAFIGNELLELGGQPTKVLHYRHSTGPRTMDYWVDPKQKPIALVRMISKGAKTEHNYELTIKAHVKDVAKSIDPNSVGPLTEKGRAALGLKK